MKKNILLNSTIIASLLISPVCFAQDSSSASSHQNVLSAEQQASSKKAINSYKEKQKGLLKKVNQSVRQGYQEVVKATKLLEENKTDKALAALEKATGKFDVALAANPTLGFVPIDTQIDINELITTPKLVKTTISETKDLLDDYKVQAARALLDSLVDELTITTVTIPMASYPDVIKAATKALVDGKTEDAKEILTVGLSTFVIETSVTPLSALRAERLLEDASNIKDDKEKAKRYIETARKQLDVGVLLGYFDKDDALYQRVQTGIKKLSKVVDDKNKIVKLYDELQSSILKLIHNLKNDK